MSIESHIKPEFKQPIRDLVYEIVVGNYEKLASDGRIGRCDPKDIQRVIEEYYATFVELPEEAFERADMIKLAGIKEQWSIDCPLWTKEEGESDMTLFLLATRSGGEWKFEIQDLRVP